MADPKNPKVNVARTTLVDSGWSLPPSSAPAPAPEPGQRAQEAELDDLLSDAGPLEPPPGAPRPLPPYDQRAGHDSMTEVNERPALLERERLRNQQGSVEDLTDFAEAVPEETVRAQSPLEQFEEEASKVRPTEAGHPVAEAPAVGVPPSREPTVQVPKSFLDAAREKSRQPLPARFPDVRTEVVHEPEDALTVPQPKVQPARVVVSLDRAVEELAPGASSNESADVVTSAAPPADTGVPRELPDFGDPPLPRFNSSPFGAASAPSSPTAADPLPRFDAPDLAPPLPRFGSDPEASPNPGEAPPVSAGPPPLAGTPPTLGGPEPSALVSPVHGGAFAAMRSQGGLSLGAFSLGEWFRARVKMAGGVVPGSALAISMVLAFAVVTALVTAVVVGNTRGEPVGSKAPEATSERSPATAEEDDSESSPATQVHATGAALEALKARPADELSPKEILAISRGEALAKRQKLRELAERLKADPKVLEENPVQKQLMESAADDATMLETLELLAELPGPIGPDLLYEVWTGTAARTESTRLAELLVNSASVRAKASPGLIVALDLRAVEEDCAVAAAVVPKAHESGDRRSLHLLGRLLRRYGCGAKKREDCFPCLRQNEAVAEAIAAVRARPAPRY